jgi:Hpt domain
MKTSATLKKFIFNEKIDADFLYSLYEDDYAYIAEVFQTTLKHFEDDLGQITLAYDDQDLEGLRKAVHKFKPIFGFTGLMNYQNQIGLIEDSLSKPITREELTAVYSSLKSVIDDGKEIIEADNKRLIDYSGSNS